MKSGTPNPRHDGESGFVLLAAIVLVVLLLISLAIAAPKVAQSIQRDKELETIHRGEQYRLAIKLYYQKFGSYPTSIDQLLNTNNMRFLRQRYTDPMTGKDDWKPILFGHAHVRPLGFFGKPLSAVGGIAASGVVGGGMTPGMYAIEPASTDANGVPTGGTGSSDDTTGGTGSSWGSTSGFGSGNGGFGSGSSGFGSGSSLGSSSSGFGSGSNLGSSSSGFGSSTSGFGSSGSGFGSSTSGFGSSSTTDGGSTLGSGFGSAGSTSGSTFGSNGVGPIVGFTLPVKKASLIDYMEQTAYNKWEFNYDPAADQLQQAVSLFGGGATMNNSSSGSTATGFGSNSSTNGSGSLFGSSSGFGSSGFGTSNSNSGTSNSGTQNGTNPPTTNPQSPDPNSPQQ